MGKQKARIVSDIDQQKKSATNISQRLDNAGFVQKAPPEVVEADRKRLEALNAKIQELEKTIKGLE